MTNSNISASDVASKLIKDHPELFKNDAETFLAIGIALINFEHATATSIVDGTFERENPITTPIMDIYSNQ